MFAFFPFDSGMYTSQYGASASVLFVIKYLSKRSQQYSYFCEHSLPTTRMVDPPNSRGTLEIVWNCIATLIIGCWTMLHLNLPAETDGFWVIFWRNARWMLLGILSPELPLLFAAG